MTRLEDLPLRDRLINRGGLREIGARVDRLNPTPEDREAAWRRVHDAFVLERHRG